MAWYEPAPLLLPDLIELNSRWLADKPALIIDGRERSWAQFGSRTARVAGGLIALGLRPGDRAVVLMRNSAEMAEAMFGAIRAGICVVPLNVAVSDEAVAGMIDDSGARLVIASDEHVERIESMRDRLKNVPDGRLVAVDAEAGGWLSFGEFLSAGGEVPADAVTPERECNIIYSSGTTGLPKGIVQDHACRAAWAMEMSVALRYESGARTLCSLGLYSNISWVAMLATIYAGGTIVVERRFTPETCLETIQAQRVTHSAVVPVQLQRLLELPSYDDYDVSSLRAVMCCGSPLAPDLKRRIIAKLPGDFIELYGLTEGLVTIMPPEEMAARLDSVGRPCPGQDLRILDNNDNPLGPGEAGEIVGRSRLLMAGYHGNDAATREATWEDPNGRRWLRTGDIGRLDEHGYLYLVDRKKDMIISGGQNIYPADIEAVLLQHDKVSDAAVIGVPSERWGETPLAVIVPAKGETIDTDELIAWANARLGKQQRVAAAQTVAALPRNPNGKVLKRELRERFADIRL